MKIKIFDIENIATFYLVLMCIQIIPIEGWGVSNVKVAAMMLAPLILIKKAPNLSKAIVFGSIYYAIVLIMASRFDTFRSSTVIYLGMFILMFCMYYNLLYKGAFKIDYFIRLLKFIILAFTTFLIFQPLLVFFGVKNFPLLNMVGQEYLVFNKFNSLTLEPSHSARIMTVCFWGLLTSFEIKNGNILSLRKLFYENKLVIIGFIYSMIFMGSATAFIGLLVIGIYFIKKKYLYFVIPSLIIFYFIIPSLNYEQLNRARDVINATMTGDAENVIEIDKSAAVRVIPFMNTLQHLDLKSQVTWFGEGTDAFNTYDNYGKNRLIGGINDYGLLSYIFLFIFIYICCLRSLLSIETLIFIILMGTSISNIYYVWSMLMIFSTIKYFNFQIPKKQVKYRLKIV